MIQFLIMLSKKKHNLITNLTKIKFIIVNIVLLNSIYFLDEGQLWHYSIVVCSVGKSFQSR